MSWTFYDRYGQLRTAAAIPAELAYGTLTTTVSVTSTVEATGTTIVTAPSISVDGSTTILVEFFSNDVRLPTGASDNMVISLFEGATQISRIATLQPAAITQQTILAVNGRYRFTPSAGSHTYSVTARVSSTTGSPQVNGGTGGTSGNAPTFIRITRVS